MASDNMDKVFNFNDYDIVGFDLDGTLLRYKLDEMVPMEYKSLNSFLVNNLDYSKDLLPPMDKTRFDFLQKGLFIDAERGNIVKMDSTGFILRATHGTKVLNDDEIMHYYGQNKCWNTGANYAKDPLAVWDGPMSCEIRASLDYFDVPAPLIFAQIVDTIDKHAHGSAYCVWPDVLHSLIANYGRENYANGFSKYFEAIRRDPNRYICEAPAELKDWLKEMKKTKATFLLTGSHSDFANFTASYAFGANWKDLFDSVITFAKKPGFFTESRDFYKLDKHIETEKMPTSQLKLNQNYSQGNWNGLKVLLATKFNKNPKTVKSVYVGDNIIQDIYTAKKYSNLDTVAIVRELNEKGAFEKDKEVENYRSIIVSTKWGSYFNLQGKKTIWYDILEKYADYAVPTVDFLYRYPIDHGYDRQKFIEMIQENKAPDAN